MIGKGDKEQTIGQEIKFKVEKSKVSPAHVNNQFRYYFKDVPEEGIKAGTVDGTDEIVRYGSLYGVIEQAGGWFEIYGERFHGQDAVDVYLRKNPEIRKKIKKFIIDRIQLLGLRLKEDLFHSVKTQYMTITRQILEFRDLLVFMILEKHQESQSI